MNIRLGVPAYKTEMVDLRHDHVGVVRKANGSPANHGRSGLSWLEATARTIDFRRDDLERTHWKKVWRSMVVD